MDHQVYLRLSQAQTNGVPQESKLANYMSIPGTSSPNNLHQAFQNKLHIGGATVTSTATPQKKAIIASPQCIAGLVPSAPASPNIFSSYPSSIDTTPVRCIPPSSVLDDSENGANHHQHQTSPAPSRVGSGSPMLPDAATPGNNIALAAYQENVGGTTYFYPTAASSDSCQQPSDVVIHQQQQQQQHHPQQQQNQHPHHHHHSHHHHHHNSVGGGVPVAASIPSTPEFNVYPGTPNHIAALKSKQDSSFFISKDLQEEIMERHQIALSQGNQQYPTDLPQVENYHELCPLERIPSNSLHKTHLGGYQASMYKAVHVKTGTPYCLRRLHAMIFVYDYYPGSETLLSKYFSSDQPDPFAPETSPRPYSHQKNNILRHQQTNKLPEFLIWNYIIQLTSALRLIHSSGLACRSLDPTKIIITSKNRLRLSCLGVMDVVSTETNSTSMNPLALVQHYQQEDLTALGKLVLALACKSTVAVQRENISTALDITSRTYTTDLRNLIMYLLSPQQRKSITDLMPMIGARFYTQMDNLHSYIEVLEYEVSKEIENGRLFRLMAKLGTINERPELNLDGAWAETGDRYMLKLFRDYVFHQVTEDGRPWVDMAHIVQCLNKLDAGVSEKICLMSRDEQSMLVVSYAELKQCLEQSFEEVVSSSPVKKDLIEVDNDNKPVNLK